MTTSHTSVAVGFAQMRPSGHELAKPLRNVFIVPMSIRHHGDAFLLAKHTACSGLVALVPDCQNLTVDLWVKLHTQNPLIHLVGLIWEVFAGGDSLCP